MYCKIDNFMYFKDVSRQMHIPVPSLASLFCFFSLFQSVASVADVEGMHTMLLWHRLFFICYKIT